MSPSVNKLVLEAIHSLQHPTEVAIKSYVNARRRCGWLRLFWAIEKLEKTHKIYCWWVDGVRHIYPKEPAR